LFGDQIAFANAPLVKPLRIPNGTTLEQLQVNRHAKLPALIVDDAKGLQVLYVTENAMLASLTISGLAALRCLVVSQNAALATLTLSLAGLSHLYVNFNPILSLLDLTGTPKIETLHVRSNDALTTMKGLPELLKLKELHINDNQKLIGSKRESKIKRQRAAELSILNIYSLSSGDIGRRG
jgi:hypothetical protein